MTASATTAITRYVGHHAPPGIVVPSPLPHDQNGLPGGPMWKSTLWRMALTIIRKTMLANAASTIHFDAIPIPSTTPSATSEASDELWLRLWMWTRYMKYASRMKNTGKMSIMPILDWMKNIPSKQANVAAEIANSRFGHSRRAKRYIIGMHKVPKMHAAMRHPKVLNPRSM